MRFSSPRNQRIHVLLTARERQQLEALAARDGRTLTATLAELVTHAHNVGVADGSLSRELPPLRESSPAPALRRKVRR